MAISWLELHTGHQTGVGRDGVDDGPLPHVPNFDGVILAAGGQMVAVRRPVDGQHIALMAGHEHNTPARPEVPNPPEGVFAARGRKGPVFLHADARHAFAVALLEQNLLALLYFPQPPTHVLNGEGQKPA